LMRVHSLYSPEEVSGAGKRENSAEADRTLGQTGPAGQYPREQLLELRTCGDHITSDSIR